MRQITLPIGETYSYEAEDFIVSSSNREAYGRVLEGKSLWGARPYLHSLLLEGPKSSGKSHMARIWLEKTGGLLLNPSEPIDAGRAEGYGSFLIEDIDGVPEEKNLLALFNMVNESGKPLLLTATSGRGSLKLPDLESRINSLAKVSIKMADDYLAKVVLFRSFSLNSLKISDKTLDFLLSRLPRELGALIEAARKIAAFSLEYKKNLTVPFIKSLPSKEIFGRE